MKTNIDKVQLDIDALIQVHNMTDFSKGISNDQTHRMTMIGVINIHVLECQNQECPCKDEYELFDVATNQFSIRNQQAPHLDEVFLNHFIKRLYEDSLNKFINSPNIHIAFSYYLFKVLKNIHASLIELNIAQKKKPSLQQQFTIFRYKNIIEEYIQQDHVEHKHVYPELANVIEFERLFSEMQRSIEKVCNLQVEFWTHLTTVVPDLNILNELGKKIYEAGEESDFYWAQLCKINSHYPSALSVYGEYLKDIRNHEHQGNLFIERAFSSISNKKTLDEIGKSSDILFSDDTSVIHVSGNKESVGKILKTSQGLSKVFGYSKTEVIGHSVNILMPTLFARKHTDFLERFFKTGRQIIFYQERNLFATHRNGYCFHMKILVKQMPTLSEGIQYVGMIKPIVSDAEFMLTDMDGVIDSFSKGVTSLLNITPNLFKDKDAQINIQLLAPDLISFFVETQRRGGKAAKSKYRDAGGDTLQLIVPKDFHSIAKSEAKQNTRSGGGRNRNKGQPQANRRTGLFKTFLKFLSKPKKIPLDKMPRAEDILNLQEYKNPDKRCEVTCEITCIDIKCSSTDSMKALVFKFSNSTGKERNHKIGLTNENFQQLLLAGGGLMDFGEEHTNAFDYCKQNTASSGAPEEDEEDQHHHLAYTKQTLGNQSSIGTTTPNYASGNQDGGFSTNQALYIQNQNLQQIQQSNSTNKSQPVDTQQQMQLNNLVNPAENQEKMPYSSSKFKPGTGSQQVIQSHRIQSGIESDGRLQQSSVHKGSELHQQQQQNQDVLSSARPQSSVAQKGDDKQSSSVPTSKGGNIPNAGTGTLGKKKMLQFKTPSSSDNSKVRDSSNAVQNIEQDESSKNVGSGPQGAVPTGGSRTSEVNHQVIEEVDSERKSNEDDNVSDVETPRVDISGLKLDSAQKEKNSFLLELKKQSFLVSEDSTQKMDVKDISAIQPGKQSDDSKKIESGVNDGQPQSKSSFGNALNVMQDAEKMVKKKNQNNMIHKNFIGDNIQEDEVDIIETENSKAPNHDEDRKSGDEDEDSSNQAGKTDEDFEEPNQSSKSKGTKHYEAELASEKKTGTKRQATRFARKAAAQSEEEDDEDQNDDDHQQSNDEENSQNEQEDSNADSEEEQDYVEDNGRVNSAGQTNTTSKKTASIHSSQRNNERMPLLGNQQQQYQGSSESRRGPAMFGGAALDVPNINDITREFVDDQPNHHYYEQDLKSQGHSPHMDNKRGSRGVANSGLLSPNAVQETTPISYKRYSQLQKKNNIKNRDTAKIKTNFRYKCVDEDSGNDDDDDVHKNDEFGLSSKEIDFRETIIKFEKKKRRKERKLKEKEAKRLKQINGDDSASSAGGASGEPGSTSGIAEDDDETHSKSSETSSESESKSSLEENGDQNTRKGNMKADTDGVSSVTSRQSKTERNHYILRMAIDEKFIPASIKNLRLAANFVFLILLVLSIIYYAIQISLLGSINSNIKNIYNSEMRFNYMMDIPMRVRTLSMLSQGLLNLNTSEVNSLDNYTRNVLKDSSIQLRLIENEITMTTAKFTQAQKDKINPPNIKIKYIKYANMPEEYQFNYWEIIMQIVTAGLRATTFAFAQFTNTNGAIYLILKNCFDSLLSASLATTDSLVEVLNEKREANISVFLYLLITASASLFFSLVFLIPVINKVKKNKQEVLELFTHRNIEKHIDDQLKSCRNFVSMRLQQSNEGAGGDHDIDDANRNGGQGAGAAGGPNGAGNAGDKELQNELNNKYMKKFRKKNKGKKWKPLNSDFGSTLMKFFVFICLIESYFLSNYLLSHTFLDQVKDLTKELQLLVSREPQHRFLQLVHQELIYSNGTSIFIGQTAEKFIPVVIPYLYDREEELLDQFSSNYDYHSPGYNENFNNLVYSSICEHLPEIASSATMRGDCETFNQGILKKGVYSSVIKYYDFMRQLQHDFMESKRTNQDIRDFLNDSRLKISEKMQDFYLKKSVRFLVQKLEEDIDDFFSIQYTQSRTVFIVYIIYIVGLYYFIWRRFVSVLQNELWKTKSMLGILPTKLCFEIEEIRHFIYAHSSNDFISSKM